MHERLSQLYRPASQQKLLKAQNLRPETQRAKAIPKNKFLLEIFRALMQEEPEALESALNYQIDRQ